MKLSPKTARSQSMIPEKGFVHILQIDENVAWFKIHMAERGMNTI